jgi:hypothetical protein
VIDGLGQLFSFDLSGAELGTLAAGAVGSLQSHDCLVGEVAPGIDAHPFGIGDHDAELAGVGSDFEQERLTVFKAVQIPFSAECGKDGFEAPIRTFLFGAIFPGEREGGRANVSFVVEIANDEPFVVLARGEVVDVIEPFFVVVKLWVAVLAGFERNLGVPSSLVGLTRVLQGLKTYFTDNPTHENAPLNVTAARATTLLTNLTNARAAVDQQKSKVRELKFVRDSHVLAVRRDLRVLLSELHVKLDPLGSKWEEFGFKRPGAMEIPEVPENLVIVSSVATAVSLKWDAAQRAQNYRVWKKVVGVDEDFVAIATISDLDHIIVGLPAGATVQIAVSATNNGGESQRSAVVSVVTV